MSYIRRTASLPPEVNSLVEKEAKTVESRGDKFNFSHFVSRLIKEESRRRNSLDGDQRGD